MSVRLQLFDETAHDLKASRQKARSPDPTPTQVWRPERLKRAGSAMKRLIFHVISMRFRKAQRKRRNNYVCNVWWLSTGPMGRVVSSADCRERAGCTHVALDESAGRARRMLKRAWNDFAAHTQRLAIGHLPPWTIGS